MEDPDETAGELFAGTERVVSDDFGHQPFHVRREGRDGVLLQVTPPDGARQTRLHLRFDTAGERHAFQRKMSRFDADQDASGTKDPTPAAVANDINTCPDT